MSRHLLVAAIASLIFPGISAAQTAPAPRPNAAAPTNSPAPAPSAPRDRVQVIHAGMLLAVPGQPPKQAQTIFVRNDRIERIVPGYAPAPGEANADVTVIELRSAFVLPGLMDMHVHLSNNNDGVTPMRLRGVSDELGSETRAQRNDVTELVDAVGNARKTLMAGYTTVRNVGSDGWHMAVLRDAIAAGKFDGPRILTSLAILRPGADTGEGACSGVEGCRRETRRQIDKGADLIKIYATCSGSKPCGRQDAPPTFLPDELRAIVETAHSRQLKVAAHAHGEAGIRAALEAGVDSIEHGSFTTPDAYPLYLRNHAFLVPTLSVQDNIRRDILTATGAMRAVMQNFLDKHGPRMMAAYRAGVRIAAGSDAGIGIHGNNARELELYVREGMPAADAIVTATTNAAALIGREADLGTIETGKIADIIAVEGDPLTDIKALQHVSFVMKDGMVFRNDPCAVGQAMKGMQNTNAIFISQGAGSGTGLKVAIKDVFDQRGAVTSAGSAALAGNAPASTDAEIVDRLHEAGCSIVGRTNMHELAYGVTGINHWSGTPLNTAYPDLIPGGSSSGAAAAVAAGLVDFAVGTDTGGSIRVPAACCGVYGLKPSFGRVSRAGTVPSHSSLDCVGPLAASLRMIAQAMAILAPDWAVATPPEKLRLGFVATPGDRQVSDLVRTLGARHAECIDVSLPDFAAAMQAGLTVIGRENWAAFAALTHSGLLGDDVQARLMAAGRISDEQLAGAEAVRRVFTRQVDALLDEVDALFLPTMPALPPTLAEAADAAAAISITANCRPFNLSGHPALSIPVGECAGRPVAMQLVTRRDCDEMLCAIAQRFVSQALPN